MEGRGGLTDYSSLGYASNRFVRAGTRTLEYAYNDFCLAQVAKGKGRLGEYYRFIEQSDNWTNLWREIEDHGSIGFIMPKDPLGNWIDSVKCDLKNGRNNYVKYTPLTYEWPICICWWCGFFYEGSSWEYSFYVPHNIPKIIEKSGGDEAFRKRLDTFFDNGYYNVGNEPSFLTSCLYHWIGKPHLSNERTRNIIELNYSSERNGIPGNDDSGAMSSWLAFHMMGFYPNAGQPYYLITTPYFKETVLSINENKTFKIKCINFTEKNIYIKSAKLNGKDFNQSWINHQDIVKGGELVLELSHKPSNWGCVKLPPAIK
ncbi:MAG: glycoside hydrolase domain-containing protein [Melioribacteraceae bacterium]